MTRSEPAPSESGPPVRSTLSPVESGSVTLPVAAPVSSSADADAESSVAADAEPAVIQPSDTAPVEAISSAAQAPSVQSPAETDAVRESAGDSAPLPNCKLQLSFSGDCWTEVTDSNGRRLYFGLGTDGRNITVSGVPPLRVLLGNNDNVSLLVDGQVYTVQASELRGNTARLSIIGS